MEIRTGRTRPGLGAGLTTGMLIDTDRGWRAAETIMAGDLVRTIDGARCAVRSVERTFHGSALADLFPQGLVLVPACALGNSAAFYLLPQSQLVFTGAAVEALSGDGAALVCAAHLTGHLGIIRALPVDGIETVRLGFDDDEAIVADADVLILCPTRRPKGTQVPGIFRALDADQARVLMSCRAFASRSDEAAA